MISRLSSNMIGNLDDKTNFPHKLLLTNKQVANLHTSTHQLILNDQKHN